MNNVISIKNQNGNLVVSSREVAENFEKRHDHVIRAIENIVTNDSTQNWGQYFIESEYRDLSGKLNKEYLLTRDGFSLLVMGFTGQKALEWKLKYIDAFNKMEHEIKKQKQLTPLDELKLHYQVLETHEEKLTEIDNRIGTLENSMTIDFAQQRRLQNKAKAKAIEVLGGIESFAYHNNSTRTKVFSTIWRDYKDYFMLGSYRDTAKKEFDKAVEYIDSWKPQGKLLREIEECNNQLAFAEVAATR